MLKDLSPGEAWELIQNQKAVLLDIREPDEIETSHIEGCVAAPLSIFPHALVPESTSEKPVIITCHSGRRVSDNMDMLEKSVKGPAYNLKGGIDAWEKAGLPLVRGRRFSMERQVRMAAGSLVVAGLVLAFASHWFVLLSLGVGCGLVYAGYSGTCGMAVVLEKMPWNRKKA